MLQKQTVSGHRASQKVFAEHHRQHAAKVAKARAAAGPSGGLRWAIHDPHAANKRETTDGCECAETWHDALGSCETYCCNPDNDPTGEWCMTEGFECGGGWGYCTAPSEDDYGGKGEGAEPLGPDEWSEEQRPIELPWPGDDSDEYDRKGDGAEPLGPGEWSEEQRPIDPDSLWPSPPEDDQFPIDLDGNRVPLRPTSPPADPNRRRFNPYVRAGHDPWHRETNGGCGCMKVWKTYVDFFDREVDCQFFCCNPDRDLKGSWCYINSWECGDKVWDYCGPVERSDWAYPAHLQGQYQYRDDPYKDYEWDRELLETESNETHKPLLAEVKTVEHKHAAAVELKRAQAAQHREGILVEGNSTWFWGRDDKQEATSGSTCNGYRCGYGAPAELMLLAGLLVAPTTSTARILARAEGHYAQRT